MKALSILATVFLFTTVLPAFAAPSDYQQWRWDKKNIKMTDIRFEPDFLILEVPVEDPNNNKFNLSVQCGNNPNFYYKQLASLSTAETMGTDKELVTNLCSEAFEIRDEYIRSLLSTENCMRINLQYGIRSIPVAQFGNNAKKKDRNENGFACDL